MKKETIGRIRKWGSLIGLTLAITLVLIGTINMAKAANQESLLQDAIMQYCECKTGEKTGAIYQINPDGSLKIDCITKKYQPQTQQAPQAEGKSQA